MLHKLIVSLASVKEQKKLVIITHVATVNQIWNFNLYCLQFLILILIIILLCMLCQLQITIITPQSFHTILHFTTMLISVFSGILSFFYLS